MFEWILNRSLAIPNIFRKTLAALVQCVTNLFSHCRTGITCKKIPCYMRDSACRWFIVENANIFRSYVKHFCIFPRERNCRILIGLCKEVFMNHPIMFLDRDNKGKLVPASFSYFLELL